MEVRITRNDDVITANVSGRIDGSNAHEFASTLKNAITSRDRALIMDIGDLHYISSAGLRAILMTAKTLQSRKSRFALCSMSGQIREIFEVSGFDKIISIYDSQAEACAALSG